jgi:hypothetical protein
MESICCANETYLEFRLESNLRIDFKKIDISQAVEKREALMNTELIFRVKKLE